MKQNASTMKKASALTLTLGALAESVIHVQGRSTTKPRGIPMSHLSIMISFVPSVYRAAVLAMGCAALVLGSVWADPSHAEGGLDPDPRVRQGTDSASSRVSFEDREANHLGRILGQVEATYGGQTIALPGATMSLEDQGGGVMGETARSDVEGHYEIPSHPPGTYRLCAEAPGFPRTCVPKPVVIKTDTQYLAHNITLHPAGKAIRGRVVLADGSPCYQLTTAFGTLVSAKITLTNGQRSVETNGNHRGEFMLADLPDPGGYTLSATCAGSRPQSVTITRAHLRGKRSVDATIPNSPPILRAVFAQDEGGKPLRAFSPGQTIEVVAEVSDPDGDPLRFQWTDGGRGVTSVNERKISWTLPDVEARSFLNVEISDGNGGFAVEQFSVGTSNTGDRFLGTVADANGKPLPKATVSVDGKAATVDAEGNYRVAVPVGERHVLTVKHPGHAPIAQVFYGAAIGLQHRLKPATRLRVDPTQPIRVSEHGIELAIEPDQLVDAAGNPPTGLLNLDLYRYDASKGELPGDPAGVTSERKDTTFLATEAVSIELTDDQGVEYELAAGSTAQLTLPAPPTETRSLQSQPMVFARYDEGKGAWRARRETARTLQHSFTSQVGHLSIWSVGQLTADTACVKIKVDPFQLDLPFTLRVLQRDVFETFVARIVTITQPTSLIPGLPPRATVLFDVSPVNTPNRIILRVPKGALGISTGENVSPAIPPFPYLACQGVDLTANLLPAKEWLTRIPGNEATANAYYDSIGARPARDTFAKWRSLNGFTAADDTKNEVVFYNPNELGLGRRVNCTIGNSLLHQACYVTKYGHVGGSPLESFTDTVFNLNPGDTVAMESDLGPADKPAVVKYYIYGPDGQLRTNTQFDTGGPKFVPGSCQHCHGRGDGKFVVLDPHAYQYPGADKGSAVGLDQQQEKFRQINNIVAYNHALPQADNYVDFLASLYPTGFDISGSKAVRAPTPPAWQSQAFLYENVIKPSCRTCHMWQTTFNFEKPVKDHLDLGLSDVCNGKMPNAMSPMLRLWKTTNPNLVHVFADSQGKNQCGDVLFGGTPPNLTIVAPSGPVSYGGVIGDGATHAATVSDSEDGQNCCQSVVWTSDVDGKLGVGTNIEFRYPVPGPRIVSVAATDKSGRMAFKSFPLIVKNDPPGVTITAPATGATIFKNTPVVVRASSFDPNVPFGVPCKRLKWTSSVTTDKAFPFTGCEKSVSFKTLGARTIKVTGTDDFGATGTATRPINVKAVPPKTPPIVTILNPRDGGLIDPTPAITLQSGVNAGAGAVTYRWTVNASGTEVDIGTGATLSWLPQNNVPFDCGGSRAVLKLYATNANGTGTATVNIKVFYPVC